MSTLSLFSLCFFVLTLASTTLLKWVLCTREACETEGVLLRDPLPIPTRLTEPLPPEILAGAALPPSCL